jgi:hypothetical protein
VFKNKLVRRIFGLMKVEVTRRHTGWGVSEK